MPEKTIEMQLDALRENIQTAEFLNGTGLSNEVNIRIFCYDPKYEMAIRHFSAQLTTDQTLKCRVILRNLFQVFLEICDENHITDKIPKIEERKGSHYLLDQLCGISTEGAFTKKINYNDHQRGRDVLLLAGVGEVFPFIRVHTLLENLQPIFTDVPILVMYPGDFNQYQLKLFNRLKPNNYYRAFTICGREKEI